MDRTRTLVRNRYGQEQVERAAPSIRSLGDRLRFAWWHYHDLRSALEEFVAERLKGSSVLEFVAEGASRADEFAMFMQRVCAYVTAFVQTLHALEDIAAHMVYYSLAMDRVGKPLKERQINGGQVQKLLTGQVGLERLREVLAAFDHSAEGKHLNALANVSKHRNIVIPRLSEDYIGGTPAHIKLSEVIYQGELFPQVVFNDFASHEFDRCSLRVINLGNELNAVLGGPGA